MKVLITDDSRVTRTILRKIMEGFDFDVIEAKNGAEALGLLTRDPVDLCLVDWNMPTMTGPELIRHMRHDERWRDIPAILVTDETERTKLAEARRAGASGYLPKPFKPEELAGLMVELGLDIGLR